MNELMNTDYAMRGTLGEIDRLFRNMFSPFAVFTPEVIGSNTGFPQMEVETDEKEIRARLPLPGFKSEQIEVEVVGDLLTVRAKRESVVPGEKSHFLKKERSCSEYEETIRLPAAVRGQDAEAKFKDGVLTVAIPRDCEQTKNHVIAVK